MCDGHLQLIAAICIALFFHGSECGRYEKALLAHLFNNSRVDAHNAQERPVYDDKKPLEVRFKISLAQIIDVDEVNQILKTSLWLDMKWYDYHFQWNPADFGNISVINIQPTKVWKPDILMYNSADEKFDSTFATNVVADHTGLMLYVPPGMFSSTCRIDIKFFPFDRQLCFIKFGSWTYDGNAIDLKLQCSDDTFQNKTGNCTKFGSADLLSYVKNGEWTLIDGPIVRNAERYDCCDVDYLDVKLYIQIQRRSLYYIFNLIIPCVLISIIALLVFTLPPDAGEKISLGVTILLSLTMFLLLVADSMPQTSVAIPLIGIYFSCIMFMCSASVVCTVLVLNYHHRSADAEDVPPFVKVFINTWLAKCLFMTPPIAPVEEIMGDSLNANLGGGLEIDPASICGQAGRSSAQKRKRYNNRMDTEFGSTTLTNSMNHGNRIYDIGLRERSSKSLLANVLDLDDDFRVLSAGVNSVSPPSYFNCVGSNTPTRHKSSTASTSGVPPPPQSAPYCTTRRELEGILSELRFITRKIKDDESDSIVGKQWKFAARVIDRVCLIFFTLFTLVSTLGILLSASTLHDGVIPIEDKLLSAG